MKFTCTKEKLLRSFILADKITAKNLSLPILNNVLLNIKDKNLIIKSTNLDLGIEISIPIKSEGSGIFSVDPKVFINFLSNIKDDVINIEELESNIYIKSENQSTIIKTQPIDDFPNIPKIKEGDKFNISIIDFIDGVKSVIYSASLSDIKPEISSVYIYKNDLGEVVFVSTDSFRLAEKKIKNNNELKPLIIPFKNALEVIRVFNDFDDEMIITYDENQIMFENNQILLISRLINGVYPDYLQIMPNDFLTKIKLKKDDFIQALKISNVFSNNFSQVDLNISTKDNLFEIVSKNNNIGESKVVVKSNISGEDAHISFSVKYILDCFQSIKGDNVFLGLNGKGKPLFIKDQNNSSFSYIVMPVNR